MFSLAVAASQAAAPHPHDVSHKETALVAPNNNHVKSKDCVKKWMTPGHAQFVDHNPHVQTPEIVNKQSISFWLKPEQDQCTQQGAGVQYIYDARRDGGGAVWVNCSLPTPDRMQYSSEIKKFSYYSFTEGSCAACDDCEGCTHGTANKLKDCQRKDDGSFECEDTTNNWQVFPQYDQWFFAYFEEYKRTTGRVTILGKDCDCGVNKGRAAFGAKLASVMIWTAALSAQAVISLANGHLPSSTQPVVAYIGDYAHDQNYNGGVGGSLWPRAPDLGADASIEESPPMESFAKGALHYESGLPPCIHYFSTTAPYAKWDAATSSGDDGEKDGDGDYGPAPADSADPKKV